MVLVSWSGCKDLMCEAVEMSWWEKQWSKMKGNATKSMVIGLSMSYFSL
jgi:uncharacterized membrane protein